MPISHALKGQVMNCSWQYAALKMSKYTLGENVCSQLNAVSHCRDANPGVRRVKIDVVDKHATTIDRSVLFLLPHLSSLKQYQTFVQEPDREREGLRGEAILFQYAGVP